MPYGLTEMVIMSQGITEEEANVIIDEQASIGRVLIND